VAVWVAVAAVDFSVRLVAQASACGVCTLEELTPTG